MSAITVDGEVVHYEVLGRGRPVVMVHGWIGSWRYWIPTMQQLYMKYRVYALDLFGYGDSDKNPERFTLEHQIRLLEEFLRELAIPKAAIIGHGLGAMVAIEFASRYQLTKVPRLLLVSAPLFDIGGLDTREPVVPVYDLFDDDVTLGDGAHNAPTIFKRPAFMEQTIPNKSSARMMQRGMSQRMKNQSANQPSNRGADGPANSGKAYKNPLKEQIGGSDMITLLDRSFRRTEPEYAKLEADVRNTDTRIIQNTVQSFDAGQILDQVRLLQMPTVVIHGNDDPIIPVPSDSVWDYITAGNEDNLPIPIPGVRHFPMLEHDRFGRLVNDFLESSDVNQLEIKERWRRRSR